MYRPYIINPKVHLFTESKPTLLSFDTKPPSKIVIKSNDNVRKNKHIEK